MIIELNKNQYALNFGANFEYISTFIKGKTIPKNKKKLIENYRILVRRLITNEKILLVHSFFLC